MNWNLIFFLILSIGLLYAFVGPFKRSPRDVLEDLKEDAENNGQDHVTSDKAFLINDELALAGFFSSKERSSFLRIQRTLPIVLPIVFVIVRGILGFRSLSGLIPTMMIGIALGYLVARLRLSQKKDAFKRSLEFYLPVVMERIVMAVESGLDIIPALGAIIELDRRASGGEDSSQLDPVTRLLGMVYKLSESGLSFERSLQEVSSKFSCSALRHAFVHLGLAQKEGGEIIAPLRELSDSTQLYYQESIEEEIAKMPVKATLPLVITFAGLILFFISSPLVQIITITQTAMPKDMPKNSGAIHGKP